MINKESHNKNNKIDNKENVFFLSTAVATATAENNHDDYDLVHQTVVDSGHEYLHDEK